MSSARAAIILVSVVTCGAAHAEAPTVTQLRLAARNEAVDTFAWRNGEAISVERRALEDLGIVIPDGIEGDTIPLSSISGLRYSLDPAAAAINIICTTECFATQRISVSQAHSATASAQAFGGYVNYDIDAQALAHQSALGGVAQSVVFGPFGLIENSWLASSETGSARLESRWTIDDPRHQVRLRFGDSIATDASGAPFRFGGVQFGRAFALAPSMITYPTPALAGDATSASTVELYVNGALQARQQVEAGPFAIDNAPLLAGAGNAQLVVTDVRGRQQIITRPFFVSTNLLRPGLSDWSLAAGALRREYGVSNAHYGRDFVSIAYRRGLSDYLTIDTSLEHFANHTAARAGVVIAAPGFRQLIVSHAESHGGANTASYYYDSANWSFGMQVERRSPDFEALSEDAFNGDHLIASAAVNFGVDLRAVGGVSFTAARLEMENQPLGATFALSYTPAIADGAFSFRVLYTARERHDLALGVSLHVPLGGDISGTINAEHDRRSEYLSVSAQSAPPPQGGLGWRARVSTGTRTRLQVGAAARSRFGDTTIEAASVDGDIGVRANQTGSVGWIDGDVFAAPVIDGGFAIIDAGAPGVSVSRDQLPIGKTGRDGRAVVVNLRPYADNVIAIDADDLPLDRAPSATEAHVIPANGAGVVVRLAAPAQLTDAHASFADGATPPRGAVLIRDRDGARFPVGSNGRVVLLGAVVDDVMYLDIAPDCRGRAPPGSSAIVLVCAAAS